MTSVRDFGATGDGKQDDSEPLQHAINDGDGFLEFPPGDYRLTRGLVVDLAKLKRIGFVGAAGTSKLIMTGPGPAIEFCGSHRKSADPGDFQPHVWSNERMPTVCQLEIEGKHPEADGLKFSGVMQPTLAGVLIRKVRHAVHITERARNVLISHCHLYHNTGIGVFLDRVNLHQANIVGSHISYNRLGGIRIENSEIRNLQITGNDIEYNNNKAFQVPKADGEPTAEIFIDCRAGGTVREGTIASNTLQATYSPNGANIRMIGGPEPDSRFVGMWTITGNLIGSQAVNVHLTSVRGVVLEGNYIYSGHQRNLLVESSRNIVIGPNGFGHNPDYKEQELCTGIKLVDCESCTLTGVLLEDAQAGRNTVAGAVPIQRNGLLELIRCRSVTLSGLQILEGSPAAIHLEECRDVLLTSSTILDRRAVKLTQHSLQWQGPGSGNMVANCRLGQPLELDPQAGVQVANNLYGA